MIKKNTWQEAVKDDSLLADIKADFEFADAETAEKLDNPVI
jgi:hypothetical protein